MIKLVKNLNFCANWLVVKHMKGGVNNKLDNEMRISKNKNGKFHTSKMGKAGMTHSIFQVCQHQQYVNPNGFIYRKLGCVDSQVIALSK